MASFYMGNSSTTANIYWTVTPSSYYPPPPKDNEEYLKRLRKWEDVWMEDNV